MRSRRMMVALLLAALLLIALLVAPPTSYEYQPVLVANPVEHVDTLIGTGTGGDIVGEINNFPGPSVPFGMVQYSPDTVGTYAGYDHAVKDVTGFSMTHASVGCPAFGDISMLPTTTAIGDAPWAATERIAHDRTEVGVPGYYRVRFPKTGVTAELTATTRTGVGRFQYPRNDKPALLYVRSGGSLAGNAAASIQIGADRTTITGWAASGGFCGKNNTYTVHFMMKFSQPFTDYGTWDGYSVYPGARNAYSSYSGFSGGYVAFPAGAVLEVRTALSYVGVDGARANLEAEGNAGFAELRAAASDQWNTVLSRIRVAGRDGRDLKTFYTALYHALLHPNTFNDADGRYLGFDNTVHTVAAGRTQYANFSDWDTYRGVAALHGLLVPRQASDMAQSLVNDAEHSGAFPRWALANAATAQMTGDSVVPLIVNLYAFGAKDFDTAGALRFMINAATTGGVGRNGYVERPGIKSYLQRGYLAQTGRFGDDHAIPGASITLEWSVDDFAIGRFAAALGRADIAEKFQDRSQYWQNLFNPSTRYISPRDAAGFFPEGPGFVEPSPLCFGQVGYDEGNAEQYLWWVPHNIGGLVTALGGAQAVADRLDRFTEKLNAGPNQPYLWAGNEVGLGVPWLYNYIGQPWKTQRLVDRIRSKLYGPSPDGVPGNDDLGAMSSWYVWAALGLYPIIPGTSVLALNTPLFDRAEITLASGESIRITAPGASGRNRLKYIDTLSVDGRASQQTALDPRVVATGAELAFTLAGKPNPAWGSAPDTAPPSFAAGSQAVTVNVSPGTVAIAPGSTGTVTLDAQRMLDDAGSSYTVTATPSPDGISVAPLSGQFAADGSASRAVAITVAPSTPPGQHPLVLTTTVGPSTRTFTLLVTVG